MRVGALGTYWMLILGRRRARRARVVSAAGANLLGPGCRGRPRLQRRRSRTELRRPARGSTRKRRPKRWLLVLSRCWALTAAWTRAPSCSAWSRSGWRRRRWCIACAARCIAHRTSGAIWPAPQNSGRGHRCGCWTERPFGNSDASSTFHLRRMWRKRWTTLCQNPNADMHCTMRMSARCTEWWGRLRVDRRNPPPGVRILSDWGEEEEI